MIVREERMEDVVEMKKKKKKRKKKKRKKEDAQLNEVVPAKRARQGKGKVKKCFTCLKEFYEEYGLTTMCPDCGADAPERKDENQTTQITTICQEKKALRPWTKEETIRMLKLHASNVGDDEIGEQLNRTASAVVSRRLNLKRRTQNPPKGIRRDWSALHKETMIFMKNQKKASTREIANHIRAKCPEIADNEDKNTKGKPHYIHAITEFLLRKSKKGLFESIGRKGKSNLWKYIGDNA